eukprot:TRINITY_DN1823_c0_g1_i1.p1 TRINITY_DN1823_c0_g1~~TRINITY_DN1823_c0_g1_i1.p1  ORF type:complete len:157 (+),score=27.52 TRINITY_DN1823_c0_g1_i1:36-473(+)
MVVRVRRKLQPEELPASEDSRVERSVCAPTAPSAATTPQKPAEPAASPVAPSEPVAVKKNKQKPPSSLDAYLATKSVRFQAFFLIFRTVVVLALFTLLHTLFQKFINEPLFQHRTAQPNVDDIIRQIQNGQMPAGVQGFQPRMRP